MGSGAKIALVVLLVLMVVAVAKFVNESGREEGVPMRPKPMKASLTLANQHSTPATLAEALPPEDSRPIIRCYTPEELSDEGTADLLACEGLEITGMAGIVKDGQTVNVIVSLKKVDTRKHP